MDTEASRLKLILNVLVLSFSIFGISQKNYFADEPSLFESLIIKLFAPVQKTVTTLRQNSGNLFQHYLLLVGVSQENEKLKHRINYLENELFQREEQKRENDRLKELLQFGQELPEQKVLAQVVGWDSSSKFKVLRINKGIKHGIRPLSSVVTSKGLVGYVYRSTQHYSDILTILDQNNRIDGVVARTRSHGIIEGFSDAKCIMKYVTRTEPVVLNDQVVTSGLGRIYPKGLVIGSISKIERESYGITQFIEITPAADMDKLEEVIVLISSERDESSQELKELDLAREEKGDS